MHALDVELELDADEVDVDVDEVDDELVGSSTQSIVPRRLEKLSRPSIFHIFAPAQY